MRVHNLAELSVFVIKIDIKTTLFEQITNGGKCPRFSY